MIVDISHGHPAQHKAVGLNHLHHSFHSFALQFRFLFPHDRLEGVLKHYMQDFAARMRQIKASLETGREGMVGSWMQGGYVHLFFGFVANASLMRHGADSTVHSLYFMNCNVQASWLSCSWCPSIDLMLMLLPLT